MSRAGELTEDAVVLGTLDYRYLSYNYLARISCILMSVVFANHSFDILVIRLGVQLRVNLKLQQDQLDYTEEEGSVCILTSLMNFKFFYYRIILLSQN